MKDIKRLYKKATQQLVQVGTRVGTRKRKAGNGLGDEVVEYPILRWKRKPHDEGSLKQFIRRLYIRHISSIPTSDERDLLALSNASPKVRAIANTPLRKSVA